MVISLVTSTAFLLSITWAEYLTNLAVNLFYLYCQIFILVDSKSVKATSNINVLMVRVQNILINKGKASTGY